MNLFARLSNGIHNWTSKLNNKHEPQLITQQISEFSDEDHALYNPKTGIIYTFSMLVEWIKKNGVQQDDKTSYMVAPYCFTIYTDSIEVCKMTSDTYLSRVALVSKHGFFRPYPNQQKELFPEFGIFFDRYVKAKSRNGRPGQRIYGTYLREIDQVTPEDFPVIRQLLLDRGINPADLRFTPKSLRRCDIFNQFRTYCTFVHNEEVRIEEERKKQTAEVEKEARRIKQLEEAEAKKLRLQEKEAKREIRINARSQAKEAQKTARRLEHEKQVVEAKARKEAAKQARMLKHEEQIAEAKARRAAKKESAEQETNEQRAARLQRHQEEMEFHRQRREHRQRLLEAITALVAAESNEAIANEPTVQTAAFFLIRMTEEVIIFEDKGEDEEHYTYYITDGFKLNVHPLSNDQFALVAKAFAQCSNVFPPTVMKILEDETKRRTAFS